MKSKSKKNTRMGAVALGILMGVTLPFTAMLPASRHASATILVKDETNILKTIEVVENTVTMIQQMYAEIELLQKAIKNMDAASALKILKVIDQQQAKLTNGHEQLRGLGAKDIETVGLWQKRIGVAQDIASGKVGPVDALEMVSKHHELLYDATTDAAKTAKAAQENNEVIAQNVKTVMEASNDAEGTKAAVQANTALIVQNTQAIMQNTELLSQMVQLEAAKVATDDTKRAAEVATWKAIAERQVVPNAKLSE